MREEGMGGQEQKDRIEEERVSGPEQRLLDFQEKFP